MLFKGKSFYLGEPTKSLIGRLVGSCEPSKIVYNTTTFQIFTLNLYFMKKRINSIFYDLYFLSRWNECVWGGGEGKVAHSTGEKGKRMLVGENVNGSEQNE